MRGYIAVGLSLSAPHSGVGTWALGGSSGKQLSECCSLIPTVCNLWASHSVPMGSPSRPEANWPGPQGAEVV